MNNILTQTIHTKTKILMLLIYNVLCALTYINCSYQSLNFNVQHKTDERIKLFILGIFLDYMQYMFKKLE